MRVALEIDLLNNKILLINFRGIKYDNVKYKPIQSPKICSSLVDNLICFMGTGMIDSMLEPHMKDSAGASQTDVVVAFIIYAGVYTVAGIVAGYVSFYQTFISQLFFTYIITLGYIKYFYYYHCFVSAL